MPTKNDLPVFFMGFKTEDCRWVGVGSTMLVAGLDLARRRDHSALVLLDVAPDRLTVTAARRLPQAPLPSSSP